jgi:aminoglycoside 3-N-acetyltransferase
VANDTVITKLFATSPYIEVLGRHIYWNNIDWLRKYGKRSRKQAPLANGKKTRFADILAWLRQQGVGESSTLLVHSAYEPLKSTGLTPDEIVGQLLKAVGETGTVCMPAIPILPKPKFSPGNTSRHLASIPVFTYSVQSNRIKTGALAKSLLAHPDAHRSRHPINTMVAVGRRAQHYMADNLVGVSPLPCGPSSSWAKVAADNAWVIGLGTDLTHSLTLIHVAEDLLDQAWPIRNWYEEKTFEIKDHDFNEHRVLRERLHKWGAYHFAERTLCKDLTQRNILTSTKIDGIVVEILSSAKLLDYLGTRNKTGYPYYGLFKNICRA